VDQVGQALARVRLAKQRVRGDLALKKRWLSGQERSARSPRERKI
jgi:hypothetical protein